jgi:hypothetical protein
MKSQMLVIAVMGLSNGMSEILMAGITRSQWAYTRFLSARPMSKHRTMPAWLTQGTPQSSGKPVGKH